MLDFFGWGAIFSGEQISGRKYGLWLGSKGKESSYTCGSEVSRGGFQPMGLAARFLEKNLSGSVDSPSLEIL